MPAKTSQLEKRVPRRIPVRASPKPSTPSLLDTRVSELVFALVAPVGTNLKYIEDALCDVLKEFDYTVASRIHVSEFLKNFELFHAGQKIRLYDRPENKRIESRMDAGNVLRRETAMGDVLALLATQKISVDRGNLGGRKAYIINSLKHPDEVRSLRRIYGPGFFLIAIHSPEPLREDRLADLIAQSNDTTESEKYRQEARNLISRDEHEPDNFGQRLRETFHLADVFLSLRSENSQAKKQAKESINRFIKLILGDPFQTPTASEYLMFYAYAAATRSGSLARQVGAVIGTERAEVLAVGCNDVPRAEGGLYLMNDPDDSRDMRRARDSSDEQKEKMVDELLRSLRDAGWLKKNKDAVEAMKLLQGTRLMSVIEFGRDAHAEMEAILSAARLGIAIKAKNLYSTTFPCHNCAKLIIAGGISQVFYIEPYPKSLAIELHGDAISFGERPMDKMFDKKAATKVLFQPFVGVGPRRYLDFFSLTTSTGSLVKRKEDDGRSIQWNPKTAVPRNPLLPFSYLERETQARAIVASIEKLK
jgi:deoxycytidylate deaminase